MKEALHDRRLHTALGLVIAGSDGLHFEIDETEGDILIEVELVPDGTTITARLGSIAGGAGVGIYAIPPVGTEVALLVPDGELECGAIIVATLSTGSISNPSGEGPTDTQTVIMNSTVLIHDGSGGTDNLVLKTAYAAHTHPTGVGPSGPPDNAVPSSSYTAVLKAK